MRICVDPGHYEGYNHSPIRRDFCEGDRMWTLALYLKEALEKRGAEVILTKTSMKANPSLADRGKKAKGCDVFISLHANSPEHRPDGTYDETIEGVVVFIPVKHPEVRPLANVIAERVADVMHTKVFDITSKPLDKYPDLDYYGVLRSSVAAGCPYDMIVEHGFYTNPSNVNFLMKDENLQKIAEVEAHTLVEWCNMHALVGDVNGDGKVNIEDVTALLDILSGSAPVTPGADVNRDGKVNVEDMTALQDILHAPQVMYRVQVGAYREKAYAAEKRKELQKKGFDSWTEVEGSWYYVYSGSYEKLKNAQDKVKKLKAAGIDSFVKAVEK